MAAQDTAEEARIAAYQKEKRLQEQMMTCWAELRENAERALMEALQGVEGLGYATPSRLPHHPTKKGMQANVTLTTSPVGAKHAVQVSGTGHFPNRGLTHAHVTRSGDRRSDESRHVSAEN